MQKDKLHGIINIILLYSFVIVGFLVTVLKAKALNEDEIGVLAIILNLSLLINSFISFGMPSAIKKFYALCKDSNANKSAFIIFSFIVPFILCTLITFFFFFLKDFFINLYDNILIDKYIDFTFLFFTGSMIIDFFSSIFQGEQNSIIGTFISKPFPKILHALFLIGYLIFDVAFDIYFIFCIVVIFLQVFFIAVLFFKKVKLAKPDFKFIKKRILKDFYKYSFFMLFGGLAGLVTSTIDSLMLGYYLSIGSVGIYSITRTVGNLLSFIGIGFGRSLHPKIAEYWNMDNTEGIKILYKENVNIQLYIGLYMYIILVVFAKDILGFLGSEYLKGEYVLIFISSGLLIDLGTGMCGGIISYSHKYYYFDFYVRLFLAAIVIFTNIIFIPIFGLNGAAFATALSLALFNLVKLFFVRLKFNMFPYTKETLRILFLFALIFIPLFYYKNIIENRGLLFVFIFSLVLFIVYFVAGCTIFNIKFSKDLLKVIRRRINR